MVSRIVCLMMFLGLACCATWRGNLPKKPLEHAHKTGCYIEEINEVIPFGDMVSPIGICYRIECSRYGLSYASCGKVLTDSSNCYVTEIDLSRPYPSCCPDVKCEEDNYLV